MYYQNELNTSTLTNTDIWKVYPILILQSNLKMLRSICGLSKKDFGIQVGVSGQTITNLENGCNSMSLMCYGAIMYFLDCVASCVACGVTDSVGEEGISEALHIIPHLNSSDIVALQEQYQTEGKIMDYADEIKDQIKQIYLKTKTARSESNSDQESASDMIKRLLDRSPVKELELSTVPEPDNSFSE